MKMPIPDLAIIDASAEATLRLGKFVALHPSRGWDDATEQAAVRTALNWIGCAVGGSPHPAVTAALGALSELAPSNQATILGRPNRLDIGSAALVNGISSHVLDFDDTHPGNLVHPGGPIVSAAIALSEHRSASGRALLDAIVLGVDVACRVANVICPDHYMRGWHVTGSAGVLGAAAASARLLGLNPLQTAMALGLAASQPIGLREQFGTMTKSFHPGAAARSGLMSALFASHGFTASAEALEGKRGYARVLSDAPNWEAGFDGLGVRFEIMLNTFKPFACGLVVHPAIDGCITLRLRHELRPEEIARVDLKVHPLVLELTGKKSPRSGLEGKFSIYHACAAALVFGSAGESAFQDGIVLRPDLAAMRGRIHAEIDESVAEESADVTILCSDGRRFHQRVDHALGSLERPMSDEALDIKFDALASPILGTDRTTSLRVGCWRLADATDVGALLVHARP